MYETLIMLKPGSSFSMDEMRGLVNVVLHSGAGAAEYPGGSIQMTSGDGNLSIHWNEAEHVAEESDQIADLFDVPCRGCRSRFEMEGHDPDMELFNDFLLINERLHATGKFVIFDAREGKLMFDETTGPTPPPG